MSKESSKLKTKKISKIVTEQKKDEFLNEQIMMQKLPNPHHNQKRRNS